MATNTLKSRIILCAKTSAQWASSTSTNILLKGEIGIETDTLKCKIGDGVNTFADLPYATVTPTELELYSKLASPAFTGTPTAPTASSDANDTQIATTEFVKTAIGSVMGNITQIEYQKFDTFEQLPSIGVKGIIYLVPHEHGDNDSCDEYIWIDNRYEKIGNTDIKSISTSILNVPSGDTLVLDGNF